MRRFGYLINSWKALLEGSGSIGKHFEITVMLRLQGFMTNHISPSTLISTAPNQLTCPFWI
jgi:hypothetical protein